MQGATAPPSLPRRRTFWVPLCLATVFVVGLVLRLHGLGERMLSHPENFAPGLTMPEWVSFPPPRMDFSSVLRGMMIDGHPPTYFVALLTWTKAFGASLSSLRLPSALLGALSILIVFRVALREGRPVAALLAATLLALNGHHLYWSQLARMYVPVAFLALLSTLYLLRLHERASRGNQVGYFATTVLALWTQLYAWPLVFAQIIATSLLAVRRRHHPVALRAQVLAVVAGLPIVQLAIYQNPPTRWQESASEYWGFGHLFYSAAPFFGDRPEPIVGLPWLIAGGIVLIVLGARTARTPELADTEVKRAPPARPLERVVALAATAVLASFAAFTSGMPGLTNAALWCLVLLPIPVVLVLPRLERAADSIATDPPSWLARWAPDLPLSFVLAVLPVLCMVGVSLVRGAFVARGTVVFLPFLAIAVAQGLDSLLRGRMRAAGVLVLALVLAVHISSVKYFQSARSSPRDYRGLADQIDAELRQDDLVLVKDDFGHPPLIYYLRHAADQLVHEHYTQALANAKRNARIWTVQFEDFNVPDAMQKAVADLEELARIETYGCSAVLYAAPDHPEEEQF